MKKNIIIALLGFLIISCSNNSQKEECLIVPSINLDSLINTCLDTSFYETLKSIPLETEKSSVITNIDGIKISKDTIYILDKRNNSILLFNLDGNFLYKINQTGRGPGEYYAIMDFFIIDNQIYLLDVKERFLIFSTKGDFINTIKLPFRARYCEYISDSKIVFQDISFDDKLKYSIGVYDLEKEDFMNTIEVIENINDDTYPFIRHKHLFKSSGGLYYNNDYSNIVYKIDTVNIKPFFQFSSKTFPSVSEVLSFNKNPLDRQNIDYKRVFYLSDILENKETITFSFFQNASFRVIYNKEKNSFSCFKHTPKFMKEYNNMFLSITMNFGKSTISSKNVPNPIINLHAINP